MRVVLQKVLSASVSVNESVVGSIGPGYLLFVGLLKDDTDQQVHSLVDKIVRLRLFDGDNGKINDRTLLEIGGGVLVVSQFTLAGKTQKGNRPDYTAAMPPDEAERLYELCIADLKKAGVQTVASGVFGAHMAVELVNDGPVTLILGDS